MADVKDGYELYKKITSELDEQGAFVVEPERPYDGYALFCEIINNLEEKGAFAG